MCNAIGGRERERDMKDRRSKKRWDGEGKPLLSKSRIPTKGRTEKEL